MEDTPFIEGSSERGISRRELLKRSAVAGVGVTTLAGLSVETAGARSSAVDTVRWVSPRGSLEVMDDYNLHVPTVMGYFKPLNINVKLNAGDASGNLPQVAAGQQDMGYASPGVLTASVEAGVPVTSVWEMIPSQVFDFVLPAESKIKNPRQLRGKTIALYNIGWKAIVDPMLAEVGLDPKTVKYREFGPQWNQAVALKSGRRRPVLGGTQGAARRHGRVLRLRQRGAQVPDRLGMGLEGAVQQLSGSHRRPQGPGKGRHLYASPRRLGDGLRVRPRQPTGGGPDRVRAVPGHAKGDDAPGCGRLDHAARKPLPHLEAAAAAPVRLPLPERVDEVPEHGVQARPDEDEADDWQACSRTTW